MTIFPRVVISSTSAGIVIFRLKENSNRYLEIDQELLNGFKRGDLHLSGI